MEFNVVHLKSNSQRVETWIAMFEGNVVGHIYMDREDKDRIKFMDAWVHEDYRRKGVYRLLWETRWEYCQKHHKGCLVYAWCKDNSLPLLMEKGFERGERCTYVERNI